MRARLCQQDSEQPTTGGGLPAPAELVKVSSHGGMETPRVSGVQGAGLDTPWSPSHVMAPETPRDDPMVQ